MAETETEATVARESNELESLVSDIAAELSALAERLNDAAMTVLADAIESGESERPDLERRISRARRTVERAAHQLRGAADTDEE